MDTKKCSKCGEIKARSEFSPRKSRQNGLQSWCKVCMRQSARESYHRNPEKHKDYSRRYREDNKERVAAMDKAYAKANPEKRRSWARKDAAKRKAAKLNAKGSHTAEQLKARFDYHGNKCVYCDSTENLHADHQIPLSRGGANFASNMVPACASCNCSKGAKTPEEFLVQQFNIAMEKLING